MKDFSNFKVLKSAHKDIILNNDMFIKSTLENQESQDDFMSLQIFLKDLL
jgi:hypothetical protein